MTHQEYTAEEIARRGREIYDRHIRRKVEPDGAFDGVFLVVDITTGNYSTGNTDLEALDRAEAKNPNGVFYLLRVGRRAAHRIGVRRALTTAL